MQCIARCRRVCDPPAFRATDVSACRRPGVRTRGPSVRCRNATSGRTDPARAAAGTPSPVSADTKAGAGDFSPFSREPGGIAVIGVGEGVGRLSPVFSAKPLETHASGNGQGAPLSPSFITSSSQCLSLGPRCERKRTTKERAARLTTSCEEERTGVRAHALGPKKEKWDKHWDDGCVLSRVC